MENPIPYKVQSGETLQDIAKKLGIKDWTKLKEYHNLNAESGQQTPDIPYSGLSLLTPSSEDIYELNGEVPELDPAEEQISGEQNQKKEKEKEEEEKKQEMPQRANTTENISLCIMLSVFVTKL